MYIKLSKQIHTLKDKHTHKIFKHNNTEKNRICGPWHCNYCLALLVLNPDWFISMHKYYTICTYHKYHWQEDITKLWYCLLNRNVNKDNLVKQYNTVNSIFIQISK